MAKSGRRNFLAVVFGAFAGAIAALVGAPVVVAFFGPSRRRTVSGSADTTASVSLDELAVGVPHKMEVVGAGIDAWDRTDPHPVGAVWLVRRSESEVEAYSAVCPHLGCLLGFDPSKKLFTCPCHESSFALGNGALLAGPAPRGMDPLPVVVKSGKAEVTFKRFVLGIRLRREA